MRFEQIGNIVTIHKGKKHEIIDARLSSSIRVLQIDDLRNDYLIKYTNDNKGVLANEDDLMIVWDGANAGTIGFGKSGYIGSTISVLRKKQPEKYSTIFLGKFLQSQFSYLRKNTTGATIPHIDRKSLETLKIPDIGFGDQIHIANILTKAENLISQRKESIHLLDEYLKSIFLEMFGDPVRNEEKWEVNSLRLISNGIENGWSPLCLNKPRNNINEWAVLKLGSVTYRNFNPGENKLLAKDTTIKKQVIPKKGDLLFSRKNTHELVGATVYIFEDQHKLLLPDTIFNIKYKRGKVSGLYLWFLFNDLNFRKNIQSLASGSAGSMPNISMEKLNKLKIPVPPLNLQTRFAQIVEKTEALKTQYQQSLLELENLYGSLSQMAFKGELSFKDEKLMMAAEPDTPYPVNHSSITNK